MICFASNFLRLQELFKLLELHLPRDRPLGFLLERGVLRFHKAPSTSSLVGQSKETKFAGEPTNLIPIWWWKMDGNAVIFCKTSSFLGSLAVKSCVESHPYIMDKSYLKSNPSVILSKEVWLLLYFWYARTFGHGVKSSLMLPKKVCGFAKVKLPIAFNFCGAAEGRNWRGNTWTNVDNADDDENAARPDPGGDEDSRESLLPLGN